MSGVSDLFMLCNVMEFYRDRCTSFLITDTQTIWTWRSLTFTAHGKANPLYWLLFDLDGCFFYLCLWRRPMTFPSKWSKVQHNFLHFTTTFDIQPWTTIPAYSRSRSTSMQNFNVKWKTTHKWHTNGHYQFSSLPALLLLLINNLSIGTGFDPR